MMTNTTNTNKNSLIKTTPILFLLAIEYFSLVLLLSDWNLFG